MVEIKREPETGHNINSLPLSPSQSPPVEDGAKYRLIYAKSKVYVNPTAYARDNIPGFAAIVKRVCGLLSSVADPSHACNRRPSRRPIS